jgi:hypothetical protein
MHFGEFIFFWKKNNGLRERTKNSVPMIPNGRTIAASEIVPRMKDGNDRTP